MGERIVSAGVFTSETDVSYLPNGVSEIGAAVIGPTLKGRALIPTEIKTQNEAIMQYGGKYDESYVPFLIESSLKNSGVITVTRLLGMNGYTAKVVPLVINSGATKTLAGVLHPSRTMDSDTVFKSEFLTSASFSSSYNGYTISGAVTSLDVNNNLTGSLLISAFAGTVTGQVYGATDSTSITSSGANFYVSGALSGSVDGSVIGLVDGVATTASLFTFNTGSIFDGYLSGTVTIGFPTAPTTFSGSVTTATVQGTIGIEVGTISGSSTVTTSATFTSSVIPQVVGGTLTLTENVILASDFYFKLKDDWYQTSLDSSDIKYIGTIFGDSPNTTLITQTADDKDKAYNYILFDDTCNAIITADATATISTASINLEFDDEQYSPAETSWITSQTVGSKVFNLFKIYTLCDGVYSNTEIKVGILNIKKASEVPGGNSGGTYGSFDIVVRLASDTDKQQQVLESFSNLNLDPTSPNYICRIIGDKYASFTLDSEGNSRINWTGDYDNKSNYIRILVDDNIKNKAYSPDLVPYGFRAYRVPFDMTYLAANSITFPAVSYITTQSYNSEYSSRVYHGFNFDFNTTDNDNYLMPLPSGSATGSNVDFNLDNITGHVDSTYTGSLSSTSALLSQRKFIMGFQGGFDGWSPSKPKLMGADIAAGNTMGLDCSTGNSEGSKLYKYAINLLGNDLKYDIKLIFTPGLLYSLHKSIINYGITMCETRGDCFYPYDIVGLPENNMNVITSTIENLDSSYSATYSPWLKYLNTETNQYMWVPPSVLMAGTYAYNDRFGYEWFAPAGMNRGGVDGAIDVYTDFYRSDMDTLYENRVNPIIKVKENGITRIVAWGQKTNQVRASALDRISARRLLIAAKKYIASTSKYLNFEQNTTALQNQFLGIANPYFESIQQRSGLYAFRVICDNSNNTGDVLDRNELVGQIFIQPSKTAEFIRVLFTVTASGATFE